MVRLIFQSLTIFMQYPATTKVGATIGRPSEFYANHNGQPPVAPTKILFDFDKDKVLNVTRQQGRTLVVCLNFMQTITGDRLSPLQKYYLILIKMKF